MSTTARHTPTSTFRSSVVKYSVVDVQDKSSPVVDYDIYFEGYFNTARLVEGTVRSVTHYTPNIEGLDYSTFSGVLEPG